MGEYLSLFCLGLQMQSNWSLSSWAYEQLCMRNSVLWFSNKRLNFECWTSLSEKTLKSLIMKYNYTLFHCGPAEILLHLNVPVCLANVLLWVLSEIWPLSKSLRWFTRLRQIDWAFLTARPTSPHCQATLHVFFVFFFKYRIHLVFSHNVCVCICYSTMLWYFDFLHFCDKIYIAIIYNCKCPQRKTVHIYFSQSDFSSSYLQYLLRSFLVF